MQFQWDLLIVDEGHRLKNAESRLAEILRSYRFKHRVLLTGTPIQNSLGELWSLLNFVLPRVFNSSETFDEWFAAPFRVRRLQLLGPSYQQRMLGCFWSETHTSFGFVAQHMHPRVQARMPDESHLARAPLK